ncbi:MAG TPA: ABC transporter ATP-binding protein [Streptosporangiaceae bacterium]|nr:ABC transporter ATP-binding protein [Streptosporangiaceae bacterium]
MRTSSQSVPRQGPGTKEGGAISTVLRARGLGKRYRRRWALSDCTLDIPAGRVVGLVGPNGAGKTTLLSLAAGLLRPTSGTIEVCGGRPGSGRGQLARVGFVAQDTPAYAGLTIADHLTLGARLSPGWDARLAASRIRRLGMSPGQRAGSLSGGQRAQLALTLAIAKRPELLILDEPVASLDPLARDAFLRDLHDTVADQELSVVHSSHLISDLERVCDYLIVLAASRVQVAGEVSELLARHRLLTAPRIDTAALPAGMEAISVRHGGPHDTAIVCDDTTAGAGTLPAVPGAALSPVGLEDLVLAYMSQSAPALEVTR